MIIGSSPEMGVNSEQTEDVASKKGDLAKRI
jgi:hypothetical protein